MARAWSLKARPQGMPQHTDFAMITIPDRPLAAGEVRIANRWLSVDPYMRGRMNDVKSYVPPFVLGEPMQGGAVGEIVESNADGFAVGDKVQHMMGWRDEAVVPAAQVQKLPAIDVPEQAFLGQLGMPGMTGYFGLTEVAAAKSGDVVFVSAAAGAVGSTVVQIAKARGMTVIGSAGGADKCDWVRSLGADAVVDYKAGVPVVKALGEALKTVGADGIDVYFDNVGGEHLDAALAHARMRARFAVCGMIEVYNSGAATELRYLARLIGNRIQIRGFIVSDYMDRQADFVRDMGALVAAGTLKREETVHDGLDAMPDAFLGLFSGGNRGKMLVRV
ncbi:NADP-dependent oxidoreductase [Sphingomonas ginsenosidivorax]|uniref:NADP-dependent oxidoreductase n=1 Tax=Sphingomonas ginsenosidivorax TaxID=862135 RepID=A0A5C6UDZ4_9SPHN|nr:NADP-dependent oxidoreductase [Sphingomonas ginsenosidivorax]TXC70952.1 NADP-dependent oxidoreductase [Sphingomonas ginsenosidivorax]